MSNSRTIQISLDHLVAEMVAFPLMTRDALEMPLAALRADLAGSTGQLWRCAEQRFAKAFPHLGLDELISIRNSIWFGMLSDRAPANEIPLQQYLRFVSRQFLDDKGPTAVPKLPTNSNHKEVHDPAARRAWRWLVFALPVDLLLAGLGKGEKGPVRVDILAPSVETMLRDNGYAETHLHLGAALDFPTAWASAVNMVGRAPPCQPMMSHNAFASPGADFHEGKLLAHWLVRAAIARYLLAAYICHGTKQSSFLAFCDRLRDKRINSQLSNVHFSAIRTAIRDLMAGRLSFQNADLRGQEQSAFVAMQFAYNALTRVSDMRLPTRLDDVQRLDPLAEYFSIHGHSGPSIQLQFLWKGLEYLEQRPDDAEFARLFWQVERVRGQVYRHCIQRPLTPGLMNFIRYYDRKKGLTGALNQIELESAGRLGGIGHGLRSLEVRLSPMPDYDKQSKFLRTLERQRTEFGAKRITREERQQQWHGGQFDHDGWKTTELGIVVHLLKMRGKHTDTGLPLAFDRENNADPRAPSNVSRFRWSAYTRQLRQTSNALAHTIQRHPQLLFFLRGLDVCRDEHGVPTWVFAPWFHHIRRVAEEVRQNYRLRHGCELPSLRTTAHLGEDFVHLTSGLRYMDEGVDHIPLVCGDRVGHGLALGIDPIDWARKVNRLAMPREDRLFDLVWERRWHAKHGSEFKNDRKTTVEDEINRVSREIFGDPGLSATEAMRFIDLLYNSKALRKIGFPDQVIDTRTLNSADERAFVRYLTEPGVYRRSRTIEWVHVAEEAESIAELQRLIRKRFADLGITIEVNPVSNLLVGDLSDLKTHPLWRLAPGLGNDSTSTLRICVGSDDPLPFSTNLPEEYQFLFDSLVLAGQSQAEARSWLSGIQRIGLESRFTVRVCG